MNTVTEFIQKNWLKTVKEPSLSNGVPLVKPFSVPCIDQGFIDFYYWDTYFSNIGFIIDGHTDQAENNLDNIAALIKELGFMPNANTITDRSQPPLFTRGVYDLYIKTGEKRVIEKYLPSMLIEQDFFARERVTPTGLNAYMTTSTEQGLITQYPLSGRVGEFFDEYKDKLRLATNLVAIAESGWDFTPRFKGEKSRFSADEYAHLDLNCILYDAENKLSFMLNEIGDERAKEFNNREQKRKELINKYMLNKDDGLYYDYNFKENAFSPIFSAASFYPFALGISADKVAAEKTLKRLEYDFGISACEYRGDDDYLQWDYPSSWAPLVYFAFTGLENAGLKTDAERVAKKYLSTVENCFITTGSLWEKYNATDGSVAVSKEYKTPQMMGWTAGVYRFLKEKFN